MLVRVWRDSTCSERPLLHVSHTWVIWCGGLQKVFESKEFGSPLDDDVTWSITLEYPDSYGTQVEAYLKFRSKCKKKNPRNDKTVFYTAAYSVKEGSGDEVDGMSVRRSLEATFRSASRNENQMKKLERNTRTRLYLGAVNFYKQDPTLTVRVDIAYVDERDEGGPATTVSQSVLEATLLRDMESLLDDDDGADAVLVDADGGEWKVHKAILAARSPVFKAMFRSDMVEAKSGRVHLQDDSGEVVQQLIKYIYTGRIDQSSLSVELMALADRYQLRLLKLLCEETLARTVSVHNVLDALATAAMYDAKRLRDAAFKYIKSHVDEVKTLPAWNELHPDVLRQMIDVFAKTE